MKKLASLLTINGLVPIYGKNSVLISKIGPNPQFIANRFIFGQSLKVLVNNQKRKQKCIHLYHNAWKPQY